MFSPSKLEVDVGGHAALDPGQPEPPVEPVLHQRFLLRVVPGTNQDGDLRGGEHLPAGAHVPDGHSALAPSSRHYKFWGDKNRGHFHRLPGR